jgi:hypothetical protein
MEQSCYELFSNRKHDSQRVKHVPISAAVLELSSQYYSATLHISIHAAEKVPDAGVGYLLYARYTTLHLPRGQEIQRSAE